MRVLHVIPSVGPARGGPSEAVLAMARALGRTGVEAEIVTANDNGAALLPVATGVWTEHAGARVFFHERWSPPVAALREFQYAATFASWFEAALPQYDGVHVHAVFSYLSTKAMTLCRKHGKRFIIRPLGQLDAWSMRQKAVKKRLYFALAEKRNLMSASAIHCTSTTEAGNVKALFPDARVEVIPHGVDAPAAPTGARIRLGERWGLKPDAPVILFMSRWAEKKNIPLLLEALFLMKEEPWTLVLAGAADDGYEAVVRAAITRHGLGERVVCPGHVQGEDKALLLHGADVFVLPSITENFGVAVAEALSCGLPCVVTEGVDIAPVVRELHGGAVCEPDAGALREALTQVLRTGGDRNRLMQAAQHQFSWTTAAERLKQLYEEVFVQ